MLEVTPGGYHEHMATKPRRTGIKKLKAQLSAYVRRAAAGERVLITDRGEVVAELVPHQPEAELTVVDRLLKMAREGKVQLTPGFPDKMPPVRLTPMTVKIPRETLRRWHEEERADKR